MRYFYFVAFLLLSLSAHSQYTLWDLLYCLNGGENISAGIPSPPPPNPVEKPGWNLIFQDEFINDSLDDNKWNKSTPWDDGDGSCIRDFAMNPANVDLFNGSAQILNTAVPCLPGCPFSSGEIKSMSVRDSSFKSYYFYATGYLESRVKLFNKTGQGAAMWLWGIGEPENPGLPGPWNEIDVFELNGTNNNLVSGTYHWSEGGNHIFQTQSVDLTDSAGTYDLSTQWTIFGLEWDTLSIKWYINNVVVKNLELKRIPPYCLNTGHYDKPVAPFCIRFSTGRNTTGDQGAHANPEDLPQAMQIDYIRVYKKKGQPAAPITIQDGLAQICSSDTSAEVSEKILYTRYYPEATYQWDSPAFDFSYEPLPIPQPPEKVRIWIKPGTGPGVAYPVYLKTIFPWNYEEKDTTWIFIPSSPPEMPPDSFFTLRIDSSCYYSITAKQQPNIPVCEYSLDGGLVWNTAQMTRLNDLDYFYFGRFRPLDTIKFEYRSVNGCGPSPILISKLIMPPPVPDCTWPAGTEDEQENQNKISRFGVNISPNPFIDKLNIRLSGNLIYRNDFHLILFDMTGRKLYEKNLGYELNSMDPDVLSPGMYFIQITMGNEIIYRGKIIRQ